MKYCIIFNILFLLGTSITVAPEQQQSHRKLRPTAVTVATWRQVFSSPATPVNSISYNSFSSFGPVGSIWGAGYHSTKFGDFPALLLATERGKAFESLATRVPIKDGAQPYFEKIITTSASSAVAIGRQISQNKAYIVLLQITDNGGTFKAQYFPLAKGSHGHDAGNDISLAPYTEGKVLWALGPCGGLNTSLTLLRSLDSGTTWQQIAFKPKYKEGVTSVYLQAVATVNAKTVWVAGNIVIGPEMNQKYEPFLVKSIDAGKTWVFKNIPQSEVFTWFSTGSLVVCGKNIILAGSTVNLRGLSFGHLVSSQDGGSSWKVHPVPVGATFIRMRAASQTSQTIWATAESHVMISNDAGKTWNSYEVKNLTGGKFRNLNQIDFLDKKTAFFNSFMKIDGYDRYVTVEYKEV